MFCLGLPIKKRYQNYLKTKQQKNKNTYGKDKMWRLGNAVLDLAQIRETDTQLYVGNKLPSHANTLFTCNTRLVIHLAVWLKSYSHWRQLHVASRLITAERRQTHDVKPNAGYQYNTNYSMRGESKQPVPTANSVWDNGNLSVSPPCGRITTLLPPDVSTAPLLKQYTKDFVEWP